MVESLQVYHRYYGESMIAECPVGSGNKMNLREISVEISRRLLKIFEKDGDGELRKSQRNAEL
jgi:hypothetical protein